MKRLSFILLCTFLSSNLFGVVIYVDKDANGNNNGTSWDDAFINLGAAINSANAGDEIRITIGSYNYGNSNFIINKNITLTGGFDGWETDGTPNNSIDNYNPNFFNGTHIFDGGISNSQAFLTIDGTTANGSITASTIIQNMVFSGSFRDYGIEIQGDNTSQDTRPTIKDCIFNSFKRSAIRIDGENGNLGVNIENCTFRYNGDTTNNPSGGALNISAPNSNSTVTIRNSTFQYNDAKDSGGAIYSTGCDYLYILDSDFTENEVPTGNGGALWIFDFSFLGIANTDFVENTAGNTGGGIYMQGANLSASATILDGTFSQNTATNFGGAIYNFYVNTTINRCKFYDNTASFGGGAFLQANAGGTIQNCVFKDNNGGGNGNATYSFYDESFAIAQPFTLGFQNCSFSANKNSSNGGSACYLSHTGTGSSNAFDNCILWDNGSSEIAPTGDATATLNYSILDDGTINGTVQLPTNVSGSNNLDSNPLFTTDSLVIACESPAVDMGSDAIHVGTTDLAGNNRNISLYPTSNTRDIGAFEVQSSAVCDCNDEGMSCDDSNPNTYNDVYDEACNCAGVPFSDGCILGDTEQLGVPGDLNVSFRTINALSCTGGELTGEAHITYRQYLKDDWFVFEGLACNENTAIIIRRPKRLRDNSATSRNNYDYCFLETWEIENATCVTDILTISVYVYREEVVNANLSLNQNSIPQDLYIAENQITSQGSIAANDTVDFVAGTDIILNPGFMAASGSNFSAKVKTPPSCNASRIAPIIPVETIIATKDRVELPSLSVYPNPADIEITLNYYLPEPSKINLALYSLSGQLLKVILNENIKNSGEYSTKLTTENYPKGIYFLQFQSANNQVIKKIVIQ